MTDLAAHAPAYAPPGHPVRRFLLGLAVLAAALMALSWSGLIAPRLAVVAERATADTGAGRGTMSLSLRNDGPLGIDVVRVGVADGRVTIGPVRVDGADLARHAARLGGGRTARLELRYAVDCARLRRGSDRPLPVKITLRTPIGIEVGHTVADTSPFELADACPGPVFGGPGAL